MHHAIHDERGARQVARVLHERDEQVEDHDVGQEDDDRPHAADDAVDQEVAQRPRGQQRVHAAADPSHERVDPLLRVGAEAECAPEHQPHQEKEDREAPQLVRHEGVDQLRGRGLFAFPRGVGLLERPLNEPVFLVGESRLDILAQGFGDAFGLAVADLRPLGVAAAAAQLFLDLPVAFEHLHGVVARREGLGQFAAVVAHIVLEPPEPLFDDGAHVYVDVAYALVLVLVHGDHGVQQRFDAFAVACLDGYHRYAEHPSQVVVIELRTA